MAVLLEEDAGGNHAAPGDDVTDTTVRLPRGPGPDTLHRRASVLSPSVASCVNTVSLA